MFLLTLIAVKEHPPLGFQNQYHSQSPQSSLPMTSTRISRGMRLAWHVIILRASTRFEKLYSYFVLVLVFRSESPYYMYYTRRKKHTDFGKSSKQRLLELYTSAFHNNTALGGEIYTESTTTCVQISNKAIGKSEKSVLTHKYSKTLLYDYLVITATMKLSPSFFFLF